MTVFGDCLGSRHAATKSPKSKDTSIVHERYLSSCTSLPPRSITRLTSCHTFIYSCHIFNAHSLLSAFLRERLAVNSHPTYEQTNSTRPTLTSLIRLPTYINCPISVLAGLSGHLIFSYTLPSLDTSRTIVQSADLFTGLLFTYLLHNSHHHRSAFP